MDKNELNQTKGITNIVSKESSNKQRDIIESVLTIVGVIAFAFIVSLICKKATVVESEPELTIGTNDAEIKLYNADYDGAISLYDLSKENEEWPMYKVKEAEAYSLKGDCTYSNRLLSDAYDKRNELIRKDGISKYEEQDIELGKLMIFTALMNGEKEKALQYGEIFLLDEGENEEIYKTMFTVYLANGKRDKAQQILGDLNYDSNSATDLSQVAYMNMIIGDYDKGISYLKAAYEVNKDEVKIYDVIRDVMKYQGDKLKKKLKSLSKDNENEECYDVFLAKCYSLDGSKLEEAQKILDKFNEHNLPCKIIQADIYKHLGQVDKYNELIEKIIEDEKDNYYGKYIKAQYALENRNYDEAIEYAKKSIIDNRDYISTYYNLMPELLLSKKQSEKSESYIRTALYKEPFNYNVLVNLADYFNNIRKVSDRALKYYDLAVAIDADNSDVYYEMAIAKIALKKKDEAENLLNEAIEKNEGQAKYYRKLANLYLDNKNGDKAIKTIRKAYDINDKDINTLNDAGYYYMSVGEIDRAITNFKAAFAGINDSTDITVRDIITKNYEKAKQYLANKNLWTKSAIDDFKYLD
ncbi:MAG: tetratricopeptide repeat protein [Clostridium sp.]|nr:tetratricopeptide repeat protein [Clostridium sp.]